MTSSLCFTVERPVTVFEVSVIVVAWRSAVRCRLACLEYREIVVEDLPTCAQAMVKWNGAGTSKIACNWKLKKREGYENPALLHTAFNGMVARHVTNPNPKGRKSGAVGKAVWFRWCLQVRLESHEGRGDSREGMVNLRQRYSILTW